MGGKNYVFFVCLSRTYWVADMTGINFTKFETLTLYLKNAFFLASDSTLLIRPAYLVIFMLRAFSVQ